MKIRKILFSLILGVMILSASIFVMMANSQQKTNKIYADEISADVFDDVEPEFKEDENTGATYTINFDLNLISGLIYAFGLEFESKSVASGSHVGTLPTIGSWDTDFEFMGWYTGKNLSSSTYAGVGGTYCSTIVNKNMTFYAQWEPHYVLTVNLQGGTITSANGWSIASGGETATLDCVESGRTDRWGKFETLPTVTRQGYTLRGWSTHPQGNAGFLTAPVYAEPKTTIYAVWQPNVYKVTLDSQGGTGGPSAYWYKYEQSSPSYYYTDAACTISMGESITCPTKVGYTFVGYYTGTNGSGTQYVNRDGWCVNNIYRTVGNATLYAQWEINSYTINYDSNGGTGYMASQQFTFENDKNLSTNAFTKEDYKFIGWEAESYDGQTKSIQPNLTLSEVVGKLGFEYVDAEITLKAKWSTEAFNANIYIQDTNGEYEFKEKRNVEREIGASVATVAGDLGYTIAGGIEYSHAIRKPINYFKAKNKDSVAGTYNAANGSWSFKFDDKSYEYGGDTEYVYCELTETMYYIGKIARTLSTNFTYTGQSYMSLELSPALQSAIYNSEDLSTYLSISLDELVVGTMYVLSFNTYGTDSGFSITNLYIREKDETTETITTIDDVVTDIDIYYTRCTHTVTVDPNKGTWNGNSENSTFSGYYQSQHDLPNAVRPGYTFGGWRQVSGSATIANQKVTIGTSDVVLQAIWTGDNISGGGTGGGGAGDGSEGGTGGGSGDGTGDDTGVVIGNRYVIEYDENGGQEIADGIYNTRESEQTITLSTASRDGYTFVGWEIVSGENSSPLGSSIGEDKLTLTIPADDYGNITVRAIWNVIEYNITIVNNEGTSSVSKYTINDNSDQTITLTPTTKEGFAFAGWTTDRDVSEVGVNNDTNVLTIKAGTFGDISITALWNAETYNVSWNGTSGLDSSIMVTKPLMWNYAGANGYTSTNLGSKYLYTISESSVRSSVTYNTILDYYTPIPVVAGYTLEGWFTGEDGTGSMVADAYGNWVASVDSYTDSYKRWIYDDSDGNLELYAKYTPTEYAIAYDYVGGTGTNPATYTFEQSQTIADPTKVGYTFAGWDATLVLNRQNKATILSTGEQTYVDQTADAVVYEIFYIKNGITYSGTLFDGNITWLKYTNTSVTTLASTEQITGTGVYVANYYPNGNTDDAVYVDFTIPSGGFATSTNKLMGKLLLKAKWTINQYKLTVNPSGGLWNNTSSSSDVIANYSTQLAVADPTRLGYTFAGWTYSGVGEWYEDLKMFVYTGNGTLTATWNAISPTISISAMPNDDETQSTIVYGQNVIFTANAKHDLGITYQWHISKTQGFTPSEVGNTAISGAVNSVYTYQSVAPGTYYIKCVATANEISVTSNEIKVIVNKAENVFDVNVKYGLIYNATAQVLLEANDKNEEENDVYYTVYKYENNTLGDEVPQATDLPRATDAGTYIVYFAVAETDNYLGLTGSAIVSIDELYTNLTIDPAGGTWNNTSETTTFTQLTGHTQEIADPTRLGSEFTGWAISGTGTFNEATKTFTYGLTDTTLTATWNAIRYQIVIDENGGNQVEDLEYITGETEKTLPTLTRPGYTFKEWKFVQYSNPAATLNGNNLIIPANATENMELKAEWTGLTNAITYNVNGGSWKHGFEPSEEQTKYITSESETIINLPVAENIERAGYTFSGWDYNGSTINGQLTISANSYGDISLIAVWTGNTYNITYETNGGSFASGYNPTTNSYTTQDIQDYELKALPRASYIVRGGYTFVAWVIEENSNPSSSVLGNDISIPANAYGDIKLKATWNSAKNNIQYNTNEGKWNDGYTITPTDYLTSESEQAFNLPTADNIAREGYTFAGWKITRNTNYATSTITGTQNTTLVVPANAYVATGDFLTLQAQWTINQYKLTLDYATDGKENAEVVQDYGSTYTPADPEKEGYDFVDWALTGGGSYKDGVYTFGAADGTLTAQWAIKQYTLTVKPNGGKWSFENAEPSEADKPITKDYGKSIQIADPTRYGYTFSGWAFESEDGGVANGLFNSEDKLYTFGAGNDTLTALWTVNTYELIVDLNYDKDFDITTYPYEDSVRRYTQDYNTIKEHAPYERRGHIFVEWKFEGDGVFEQLDDGGYKYLFLGDGLLTAVWKENSYLLELDYQGGTVSHLGKSFEDMRDYTYDIYELPEDYDPTLTWGEGSAGWELGVHQDYTAGYINLEDGTGFNGDRSLYVRIDQPGTSSYQHRITYALFRDIGGLPLGKYQLDMYVKADKLTSVFQIFSESYYEESYQGTFDIRYHNLSPNVWYHIQKEIDILDTKASLTNLMFYLEVGTTYQIDDIKFVRLTDEYGNKYNAQSDEQISKIEYLYTKSRTQLPFAVKEGYTFLGWNEDANATESTTTGWVTHYAGDSWDHSKPVVGDKKYYAIYKLSNPTVALTTPVKTRDEATRVEYDVASQVYNAQYNGSSATLTANVSTEGLAVDKTNYQWHVSTTPNFTPSSSTAISGATAGTYTHRATDKKVGTYYYACVVSVQKGSEVSASIASDYAIVNVTQGEPYASISMADYIYSNTPSEPKCSTNISGGKLTYYYNTTESTTGGTEWKDITPTTLNAGTYYMYAAIASTENFKAGFSNIVEFKVNSKELTKPTISGNYIYNRTEQTATIENFDSTKMTIVDGSVTKATNAGIYTITIALLDKTNYNYTWEDGAANTYGTTQDLVLTWTIEQYDLSNVTIDEIPDQRYTTFAIEPKPTVTATELSNHVLVEGTEFEYSYADNIEIGTATVTITGQGNYKGTNSTTFEIRGALIDKPTITSTYKYNATEQTVTIDGFDDSTMTIVDGSVTKATNAGTYSVTIGLKQFYTWKDLSLDNITLTWTIDKADVTLTPANTPISIRVGETITNEISVATSYGGSLDGQTLRYGAPGPGLSIRLGVITSNKSLVEMYVFDPYEEKDNVRIEYNGDGNHNRTYTEIELIIIPLYVELKINGSGTAVISNSLSGSGNKYNVRLDSDITFTARPSANYGLIKYSVQNIATYMEKTTARKLTDSFTSDTITVSDTLLGNTGKSIANNIITIELWFDKIVNVNLDTDLTRTGATSHEISTLYEDKEVNFEYNETTKVLTAFESAKLSVDVTANKIGDQYYIINKVTIGDQTEGRKALNTVINTDVKTLTEGSNVSVQAVKVFNAEDKSVSDKSASIGTVKVNANAVYEFEISNEKYVIENSPVDIKITTTNDNYDFLAIKVNGVVMLKGQFEGAWEHDGDVSTWKGQQYTKELSEIEAIILEKWYTAGDSGRTVEVQVADGIDAKLVNTDIGYSYTLADNIFNVSGAESLHVGNWKVHVESANVTNYQVKVTVNGQVYGKDEIFKIDSTITSVVIEITAL